MSCDRHPGNPPPWWGDKRGCYECAKENYAQVMIDRDRGKPKWLRDHLTGKPEDDALYYYTVTDIKGETHGGEWRHPNSIPRRK